MTLRFGSVCSGIEAASVAWEALGWRPAFFSEIEPFPRAVLEQRQRAKCMRTWRKADSLRGAHVALWSDFTAMRVRHFRRLGLPMPDILAGGTPCQSFSFAGLRGGLADARGNLTLEFVRLAHAFRRAGSLRGVFWENVPGVLSHEDNPFGCLLGALVGSDAPLHTPDGKRWPDAGMVAGPWARAAWRVFDAQFFGLAQRRSCVFLIVDFGGWCDPAAVLFEPAGGSRHPPACVAARKGASRASARPAGKRGIWRQIAEALGARRAAGIADIAPTLPASTRGGGEPGTDFDCDGGLVAAFAGGNTAGPVDVAATLTAKGQRIDFEVETFIAHTLPAEGFDLSAGPGMKQTTYLAESMAIRRLTPVEWERLQGFADNHTRIAWRGQRPENCPDGPRYKSIGNSWPVDVVAWLGRRIDASMKGAPIPDALGRAA